MDFQVLPHRKLKKRSISLIALFLLVPVLALVPFALLYDPEEFSRPHSILPGLLGSLLGTGIGFLVYVRRLHRQQLRLQQALRDFDLVQLTNEGKVGLFLYLRSFKMGRSTLLRRLVPYAYGDQPLLHAIFGAEAFHFEEDISNAIVPHGLLIAIGDRKDSYGAGKIIVGDEKWKDHFHWLATHSWTIFMQPDLTQSVRWEVGQLVGNMSYLRKTVWVMPYKGKRKWTEIRDGLQQDIGVVLPHHRAGGGMFRLRSSGDAPVFPPNKFLSVLTKALEEANHSGRLFDVEEVWERPLADERGKRANDEALREIRRKVMGW
jgi:hypothetical protein